MSVPGEQVLLRAYLLTTDQTRFTPSYQWLVQRARKHKLAGATVLRGILGFGSRGIHQPSDWHLTSKAPAIVEIVDAPDRIAQFIHGDILPTLQHGLITLERAAVMMYRHRHATDPQAPLQLLGRVKELSTLPILPSTPGGNPMTTNQDGILLRIFAGDSDTADGKPLHEAIVRTAKDLGLSGATVLRGAMGFGANSVLHTSKLLELSTDLPIVIELVDSEENIRKLLPYLDTVVREGMITMESVRILLYRHNPAPPTTPTPPHAPIKNRKPKLENEKTPAAQARGSFVEIVFWTTPAFLRSDTTPVRKGSIFFTGRAP